MAGALPGLGQSAYGQAVSRTGTAVSPNNAEAQFRLGADTITRIGLAESAPTGGTFSLEFRWLTGCYPPSNYWVRSTETSGVFSTDPSNGAWIQLSSDRLWRRNRTNDAAGSDTVVATFEIATDSAGANIIATFTVTLTATVLI